MSVLTQQSQVISHPRAESLCWPRRLRVAGFLAAILLAPVALTGTASAGCGLTVTFDNDMSAAITIKSVEAKTSTGSWKTVYSPDFTVGPGKKKTKAIETNAGCVLPHHLRAKYEKGKNALYKTKGPIATAVDKKITLEFDD